MNPLYTSLILTALFLIFTTSFLRLLYILPATNRTRPSPRKRGTSTHLLIVLGSGGHTAEMLSLLSNLDPNSYTHRTYVVSSGDAFSVSQAIEFERLLEARTFTIPPNAATRPLDHSKTSPHTPPYSVHTIPRARRIHQSLLTTPFTSLNCLRACISLLRSHPPYPDLILLNGPATSVILLLAAILLRFFAVQGSRGKMRSIYIESWARVKRLSLSGKILVAAGAVERVLVQWEELADTGIGEFRGCLVR